MGKHIFYIELSIPFRKSSESRAVYCVFRFNFILCESFVITDTMFFRATSVDSEH